MDMASIKRQLVCSLYTLFLTETDLVSGETKISKKMHKWSERPTSLTKVREMLTPLLTISNMCPWSCLYPFICWSKVLIKTKNFWYFCLWDHQCENHQLWQDSQKQLSEVVSKICGGPWLITAGFLVCLSIRRNDIQKRQNHHMITEMSLFMPPFLSGWEIFMKLIFGNADSMGTGALLFPSQVSVKSKIIGCDMIVKVQVK